MNGTHFYSVFRCKQSIEVFFYSNSNDSSWKHGNLILAGKGATFTSKVFIGHFQLSWLRKVFSVATNYNKPYACTQFITKVKADMMLLLKDQIQTNKVTAGTTRVWQRQAGQEQVFRWGERSNRQHC